MLVYFTKKKNIKNVFLCVAYGHYPNVFFYKKTNIWSFKNMFLHGFFKHNKKIIFLHSGFYNIFVNLQRVLVNISKNKKSLILGEFIYYSPLMFG